MQIPCALMLKDEREASQWPLFVVQKWLPSERSSLIRFEASEGCEAF